MMTITQTQAEGPFRELATQGDHMYYGNGPWNSEDARVMLWADPTTIEPAALQQIENVASLPWTVGVAVMPDVHYGKGATVGTVIASTSAVSPAAVGVDIGCGMAAVRTSLEVGDFGADELATLRQRLEAAIPVGFNTHETMSPLLKTLDLLSEPEDTLTGRYLALTSRFLDLHAPVGDRFDNAVAQLGTLGGGNHFIELCSDEEGRIWLTLHSGSRNIGLRIANHHIAVAKAQSHNDFLIGEARDLSALLVGTPEFDAYLADVEWAQSYALLNRQIMLNTALRELSSWWRGEAGITTDSEINVHHNYVAKEHHFNVDLYITRKGAINADEGTLALIPGSMGTGSYVVEGMGNAVSFRSASHGAGRKMSRAAAKRTFTETDLAEQTAGIECRKDAGVIDEAPGAYKDIENVMSLQETLVKPVHRLRTLMCIKG